MSQWGNSVSGDLNMIPGTTWDPQTGRGRTPQSSPLTDKCLPGHSGPPPIINKHIHFKAEESRLWWVYTFNFSNGEEEAEQPLLVLGQLGLHSEKVHPATHKSK